MSCDMAKTVWRERAPVAVTHRKSLSTLILKSYATFFVISSTIIFYAETVFSGIISGGMEQIKESAGFWKAIPLVMAILWGWRFREVSACKLSCQYKSLTKNSADSRYDTDIATFRPLASF
jgi:hypothetical protein